MLIKFYPFIFLLNQHFCNGIGILYGIFGIRNGFKYLIEELQTMTIPVGLQTTTRWIDQKLDNFDANETRNWKMRYFERLDYWVPNGPIYLFLGGESPASPWWTATGILYELAKETRGAMYVSEHRYYGSSKPLNGSDADSFKYLSSRQALADNANLLKFLKLSPKYKNSRVVVIGGSYSGNLAAWMKLLYPHLVDAAVASSGPVIAKTDFYEYLEKVNENYDQYGTNNCLDRIRKTFERYNILLKNAKGIDQLKEEENICEECDLTMLENQQVFFSYKVEEFMRNSQYGTTEKINDHCKVLDNHYIMSQKRSMKKDCICYDFEGMIEEFYEKDNDWILAWVYQTCTEFGYFQTTSSDSQPFTQNIPLDFYNKICFRLFGSGFDENRVDEGVATVNKIYGGLHPNVSQVVFTNGDLDPWSTLSILEDLTYQAPAVVIPRASHCRDLFSDRYGDHEELKQARKHIKYLIKKWIGAGDYITP